MIFCGRGNPDPDSAPIRRSKHNAARADRQRTSPIKNEQTIQRCDHSRALAGPNEAAIRCVKDDAVGSHGPAVLLILRKTNGANRVALWQRILPFPTAIKSLPARADECESETQANC